MSNKTKENLEELIGRFFAQQQAKEVLRDIETGEAVLSKIAAPAPSDELIEEIKSNITEQLKRRKEHSLGKLAYRMAAVAVVIIIGVSLSVRFFTEDVVNNKGTTVAMIPATIWESEDLTEADAELVILAAEIADIESELVTLQLNEMNGNGDNDVLELEMEFIEIESYFWKG